MFVTSIVLGSYGKSVDAQTIAPSSIQAEQPKAIKDKKITLPETPQKTCGDPLPNDAKTYPVSFYPVYVDYNEKSLELVKKHFCEDAFKDIREKTGKDIVQVASFTSPEKANQSKERLSHKFSGLNLQQLKELKALIGNNNRDKIDFKVVLPTYLPNGYKVHQFSAVNNTQYSIHYEITYCNFNKQCLILRADNGQWGNGPLGFSKLEIPSPALGDITLEYVEADNLSISSFATFRKPTFRS